MPQSVLQSYWEAKVDAVPRGEFVCWRKEVASAQTGVCHASTVAIAPFGMHTCPSASMINTTIFG